MSENQVLTHQLFIFKPISHTIFKELLLSEIATLKLFQKTLPAKPRTSNVLKLKTKNFIYLRL